MSLVVDTHAAIWYMTGDLRISKNALKVLDAAVSQRKTIFLSSISLVEITYLIERNRIPPQVLIQSLGIFG